MVLVVLVALVAVCWCASGITIGIETNVWKVQKPFTSAPIPPLRLVYHLLL